MTTREDRQWSIAQRLYVLETQPTAVLGNLRERVAFFRRLKSDIVDEADELYKAYLYENAYILFTNALNFTQDMHAFGDDVRFNDDKPLLFKRIQCLLKMGCYADAVNDCDIVLANEPKYNHVRIDKAEALFAMGQPELCLTTLNYFTPQQRESNSRIGYLLVKLQQLGYGFFTQASSTSQRTTGDYYSVDDISGSWMAQGAKPKYTKNPHRPFHSSTAPFIGKKKQTQKQKVATNDFDRRKSSSTNDLYKASAYQSDEDSDNSVASEISESELAQSSRRNTQHGQSGKPKERSDPIQIPSSTSRGDAGVDDDIDAGEWCTQRRRRNTIGHAQKNSPSGTKYGSSGSNKTSSPPANNVTGSGDRSKKSKRRKHKSGNGSPRNSNNNNTEHIIPEGIVRLPSIPVNNNVLISDQSKMWVKVLNLKLACRNCFSKTAFYGRIGHEYHNNMKNHNCLKDLLICPDCVATQQFRRSIWCQIRDRTKKSFNGEYRLCDMYQSDRPCKVPMDNCVFPHTSPEHEVWNAERNGTFNRNEVVLHLKLKAPVSKTSFHGANTMNGNNKGRHTPQRGVVMTHDTVLIAPSPTEFNQPNPTIPVQRPQPVPGMKQKMASSASINRQPVQFPGLWKQEQQPTGLSFGNSPILQSSASSLQSQTHHLKQASKSLLGPPPIHHAPIIHPQHTTNVFVHKTLDPMVKESQRLKAASHQSALANALLRKVKGCFTYVCQQCRYSSPPCIAYRSRNDPMCCGHPSKHPWPTSKILTHEIHENGRTRRSFIRPKLPHNITNKCRHYFRSYGCTRGDTCNFAHDNIELEVWKLEQTHGINREFLVEFCGYVTPTTKHPVPSTKITTAEVPQNKQPVTSHFNLRFVCGTCWNRSGQQRERSSKNTMTCSAGHSWKDNICLVFSEARRKWIKVNGRHPDLKPYVTPQMCKNETKCDYGNIHGKQCMFCHSEEEIKIWIFMAKHKLKTLHEVNEGKKSNNKDNKGVAQEESHQPVSSSYHCSYCEMDFKSTETLDYHISTLKHKRCVNSDTERSWKHRSPPLDVVNGRYVMCDRHKQNRCSHSEANPANNPCTHAHSQDELEEWKERHNYRMMKRHKAVERKLFSFMDQLLLEYNLSTSEVTVITEKDLPRIRIKCETKLNLFISAIERKIDELFEQRWTFEVECINGDERLKRVGLLYDEHRLHFSLSHPKDETNPQVCPGNMIMDGCTYTIDVKFTSKMLGSFHQWVVFDFGSRPVMVRKLHVHVGAEDDRPKYMKQLSSNESTVVWDTSNTEILRSTKPKPYRTRLLQLYKPASANLNIDDLNVGTLNQENYKHRMHKMVSLEERDRMKTINRLNTTTEMSITTEITLESYAGTTPFIAKYGTLYGKIQLTETLNFDSESIQLIMESVHNVLCKFDSASNQAYELKIVSGENIDGRTKDHIYVHINATCVNKLKLEPNTTQNIVVQFQLDRFTFCQMHYAIDSLENMEAVIPTPGNTLDIPCVSEDQQLNTRQKQAIQYMCLAGKSTVSGPPLVIYGPFGTGKTLTMAESVKRIIRRPDTKVLICTMSNSGADLYITEHLHTYLETYQKRGRVPKPTLLRVYQPERRVNTIHPDVKKYCLIDTDKLNLPTREDVMRSRVVICTLNMTLHLVSLNLKGQFTHILIDEAGQALETQAIMPLVMADWKTCIVIAGDHIQMSPKVYSETARIGGFGKSFLQRLHEYYKSTHDQNTIFLHYNYRTCEEILSFVSDMYYKTKLISKKNHPVHPSLYPMSFYAVRGLDHLVGTSYLNRDEVVELGYRVEDLCRKWPREWGERIDIGVVTPYASQVREIRQELRRRKLHYVRVEGVRNVQGKEFRALFISVVRTRATLAKTRITAKHNDPDESGEFNYGFLSDEKLLNTAFTRAKSHLVIVGDPIAMCSIGRCSKVWEKFLQKCEHHGSLYPEDMTLQAIRGEIEAVNTQLNPFAAPFKPTANIKGSNSDHSLGILKDFAVASSKPPELSVWQRPPTNVKTNRQISEEYPRLSTIGQSEEETYVSGDFSSIFQDVAVPHIPEIDEWQSEDEEEIDVKKIDDSILKELRRHVLQARQTEDMPHETDFDKSGSPSDLNESRESEEPSLENPTTTDDDEGEDVEDSVQINIEPTIVDANFQKQSPKEELEEIVKMIFVPAEKDHSNLQGADFFEEYDPDVDTSSEELDQDASEKKYKPLLESEPEKYKKCKFHLDVRGKTYATTLEDDAPSDICIMSKHNRGRALNNDEVIVEIQQNEDVIEEVDVMELDVKPEDEVEPVKVYGRVVHVLRRASEPHLRKIVCTLDQFSNSLMVPVNRNFPKLCMPKTENRSKSSAEDTTVAIYTLIKNAKFLFDRNVVVTNKDRRHKLFVVRYWKWLSKYIYPVGFVTEELPPGTEKSQGLHILKLIHGVEDTWKLKVRQELDGQFPETWTIPDDEIKKRIDFRDVETFTIDPKDCQDIDDAISICRLTDDHFKVGVHIADVSFFVAKDSLLDNEAQKRATSYYPMSSAPLNMLPKRLSNDLCSLQPGKDRLAVSVFMDVNANGLHRSSATGTEIVKSIIRSSRNFTYNEVEDIIHNQNNGVKPSIVAGLHKLNDLAQRSRTARLKEGRFSYNTDDGEEEASSPLAHSLIEEFMILANKAVAQYLMEKFPQCVPLKRQLPPDPEKLQEFQIKHLADIRNSKEMLGKFKDYVDSSQCNCDNVCSCGEHNNTITMQKREWNQLVKLVNDIEKGTDASPADMLKIINIVCTDQRHPHLSVMLAHYYMIQEKANYICSGQSISGGFDLAHHSQVDFYTHFTSPIRRYIDIVVHRLIHAALNESDIPYTEEEISSICYHSSIESSNAKSFENKTKTFMIALKLKEASLSYLPAVEKTSDKSINFVFPTFMSANTKFVGLNRLKPSKRPGVNDDSTTINLVWKQRIYDAKAPPEEGLPKMDKSTWELDRQRFVVTFDSAFWRDLLSGIEDDDIHQIRAALHYAKKEIDVAEKQKNKRTLLKNADGKMLKKEVTSEIQDIHGNRHHFVEFQREYSLGNLVEVKLSAGFERGLLEPKIQLFNLTPELDICIEHRSEPVTCFSQLATKKPRGAKGVKSYQERWLKVLAMFSASNSVFEDDSITIRNVSIIWYSDVDDSGSQSNQFYHGVFRLPKSFCKDRSIKFNGMVYNDKPSEDDQSKAGCYDFLCVRYVKSTWVGHCYTTMVCEDETKTTTEVYFKLNQSSSVLPMSLLHPKPGKIPVCTIELIPRGQSDMRLEDAIRYLDKTKPTLNRDIALLRNHKMGGREDDATAKRLPVLAKKIKVGKIPGVALPPPNDVQKYAIQTALAKPFTVIQGPPGTGKTVTGAQLAYYFSEMNKQVPPTGKGTPQVLYCGPSNKSVDVVAGYLKKFPGLSVVRVYSETIEKKDFPLPWEKNIGRKMETREASTNPEHINIALHHLIRSSNNSHCAEIRKMDRDFQRLKPGTIVDWKTRKCYMELISSAKEEEFNKHRIILATCNTAGSKFLQLYCSIIQCIIDEAGMCSEPESLIPLVMCLPYQVVLIGDHKQLRPIIQEKYAEEFGMGVSLLERYESKALMLTIQYRMHPRICEFPSSAFYDNKLETADSVRNRRGDGLKFWPAGAACPTVFCHVFGKEETLTVNSAEGSEQSKSNPQEIYHVVRIACKLLEKGIKAKNIVILSQYRLQCQRIRDALKARGREEVDVSTVVLSQGSEWDYVIMSTVRSLPRVEIEKQPSIRWLKMNLGFMIENQMNVALTRAKQGLILIGNQYLLQTHTKWNELLKKYDQNGCIVDPAADFRP